MSMVITIFSSLTFLKSAFEGVPYCQDVQVRAGISSHGNPEGPVQLKIRSECPHWYNNILIFPKLFSKVSSRGFQMVRMARFGLVMAPTLSLKVLTNFRVALSTDYEPILMNFNKK